MGSPPFPSLLQRAVPAAARPSPRLRAEPQLAFLHKPRSSPSRRAEGGACLASLMRAEWAARPARPPPTRSPTRAPRAHLEPVRRAPDPLRCKSMRVVCRRLRAAGVGRTSGVAGLAAREAGRLVSHSQAAADGRVVALAPSAKARVCAAVGAVGAACTAVVAGATFTEQEAGDQARVAAASLTIPSPSHFSARLSRMSGVGCRRGRIKMGQREASLSCRARCPRPHHRRRCRRRRHRRLALGRTQSLKRLRRLRRNHPQ